MRKLLHHAKFRSVVYQALFATAIVSVIYYLASRAAQNMAARELSAGFGFLSSPTGFDIGWTLIDYHSGNSYAYAFLVGVLNTLAVSALAIIITTVVGFLVGIGRLSSNWLVARTAATYVEMLRNTPLLLQILYWYLGVFQILPPPGDSVVFADGALVLNNRGLYVPAPVTERSLWPALFAGWVLLVAGIAVLRQVPRAMPERQLINLLVGLAPYAWALAILVFVTGYADFTWQIPTLRGFNYSGGLWLPPMFCAVLVAISLYTSAFVAEIVRAGIQGVPVGQTEAARSLGLRRWSILRLVVVPEAMPLIIPPLISQYLNVVKNSSLAVAVGYPDLVAIFMQTALNQSGRAVEIVAMTMGFYLVVSLIISFVLNLYNRHVMARSA